MLARPPASPQPFCLNNDSPFQHSGAPRSPSPLPPFPLPLPHFGRESRASVRLHPGGAGVHFILLSQVVRGRCINPGSPHIPRGVFDPYLRMRKERLREQPWLPGGGRGRADASNPLLQMFWLGVAQPSAGGAPPSRPPLPGLWPEAPPQAGSGGLSIPAVACRTGWLGGREGGAR